MAGNKRWSDEDIRVLEGLYGRADLGILAARLGRSPVAVQWKAWKLGLSLRRELTESDKKYIIDNRGVGYSQLAANLRTTKKQISAVVREHIRQNRKKKSDRWL